MKGLGVGRCGDWEGWHMEQAVMEGGLGRIRRSRVSRGQVWCGKGGVGLVGVCRG